MARSAGEHQHGEQLGFVLSMGIETASTSPLCMLRRCDAVPVRCLFEPMPEQQMPELVGDHVPRQHARHARVDAYEHRRPCVQQQSRQPTASGQLDKTDRPLEHELRQPNHVLRSIRRWDVKLSDQPLATLERFRIGLHRTPLPR